MSDTRERSEAERDDRGNMAEVEQGRGTVENTEGLPETPPVMPPQPPGGPNAPHVMLLDHPNGGHVAVMGNHDDARSFGASTLARLKTLIAKVGISEFGMGQSDANDLAEATLPGEQSGEAGQSVGQRQPDPSGQQTDQSAPLQMQLNNALGELERVKDERDAEVSNLRAQLQAVEEERDSLRTEQCRLQADLDAAKGQNAPQQGTGDGGQPDGTDDGQGGAGAAEKPADPPLFAGSGGHRRGPPAQPASEA